MALFNSFEEAGIDATSFKKQAPHHIICPKCGADRKKAKEPSLRVWPKEGLFKCYNCEFRGKIKDPNFNIVYQKPHKSYKKPHIPETPPPLTPAASTWLASRAISEDTAYAYGLYSTERYFPYPKEYVASDGTTKTRDKGLSSCIAFPYMTPDYECLFIQYRDAIKRFVVEADCQLIPFGMHIAAHYGGLKDKNDRPNSALIWTEGQLDCMSLYEAGCGNVVSVPNGSQQSPQLEWLDDVQDFVGLFTTHILCLDDDSAGLPLKKELMRRLGASRCKVVHYPKDAKGQHQLAKDGRPMKDANAVLTTLGAQGLKDLIEKADFEPMVSFYSKEYLLEKMMQVGDRGIDGGATLGWPEFDEYLRFSFERVTAISGTPNAGKSDFVDQIAIILNRKHGWKGSFHSPEKDYILQLGTLAAKLNSKPYFNFAHVPGDRHSVAYTKEEQVKAIDYLTDNFYFFNPTSAQLTYQQVIEDWRSLVQRYGIRFAVLDPYNYLRMDEKDEAMFIKKMLIAFKDAARELQIHVFIVAHPTKAGKIDPKGGLYSIAGSAHWANSVDNFIWLYRHIGEGRGQGYGDNTEVFVHKLRNQQFEGRLTGEDGIMLSYKMNTGEFDVASNRPAIAAPPPPKTMYTPKNTYGRNTGVVYDQEQTIKAFYAEVPQLAASLDAEGLPF